MKAKRQRHQSDFKAKVGLEALAGVETVAEIAREYQGHPTQVSQWKRPVVDRLAGDLGSCEPATVHRQHRSSSTPFIVNTDQGAQFTSAEYIGAVEEARVLVSMDGHGRWMDNRFVERLWRSLKYEDRMTLAFSAQPHCWLRIPLSGWRRGFL